MQGGEEEEVEEEEAEEEERRARQRTERGDERHDEGDTWRVGPIIGPGRGGEEGEERQRNVRWVVGGKRGM